MQRAPWITSGFADFTNLTLVLRYRGQVCYSKVASPQAGRARTTVLPGSLRSPGPSRQRRNRVVEAGGLIPHPGTLNLAVTLLLTDGTKKKQVGR